MNHLPEVSMPQHAQKWLWGRAAVQIQRTQRRCRPKSTV